MILGNGVLGYMKRFLILLLVLPSVGFTNPIDSSEFEYSSVFYCGPEKYDMFKTSDFDMYEFYFLHFDDEENVVILNDSVTFKSYEETTIPQLYYLNGGVFSLSVTKNNHIYLFELKRDYFKDDYSNVDTLIFDKLNLTYTQRTLHKNYQGEVIKSFESTVGFCHRDV
jgi:hypothetical protein